MYELGVVYRNIGRVERDVATRLGTFGTATVHEAIGRTGLLKTYMRPIYAGAQASGTAVTVLLHPGDNWMLHVAAEQIRPGDVVVAAVTAGRRRPRRSGESDRSRPFPGGDSGRRRRDAARHLDRAGDPRRGPPRPQHRVLDGSER